MQRQQNRQQYENEIELTKTSNVFETYDINKLRDLLIEEPYCNIMKSFDSKGFNNLLPTQASLLPSIFEGKTLIGQGQSGTGKTQVGCIGAIYHAYKGGVRSYINKYNEVVISSMIICNSIPLAEQFFNEIQSYLQYNDLKACLCVGKTNEEENINNILDTVPDIIIGTVGRISRLIEGKTNRANKLIQNPTLNVSRLRYLYVDEADSIFSMQKENRMRNDQVSSQKQLENIILYTRYNEGDKYHNKDTAFSFISATWNDKSIDHIHELLRYIRDDEEYPIDLVLLNEGERSRSNIREYNVNIGKYLSFEERVDTLLDILLSATSIELCVIFLNNKDEIDRLTSILCSEGLRANKVHSGVPNDYAQNTINEIKRGMTKIGVVSDVFSRGLDITGINCVINFNFPIKRKQDKSLSFAADTYIHRIGRSARGKTDGFAINFVSEEDEPLLKYITKNYNNNFQQLPNVLDTL